MNNFQQAMDAHLTRDYQECFAHNVHKTFEILHEQHMIPPGVALAIPFLSLFGLETPETKAIHDEMKKLASAFQQASKVTLQ